MSALLDQDLENTDEIFVAHSDTPGDIYHILKSLVYKEKTKLFCTVTIQEKGMKFVVESHKNFQGNAYLMRGMFSEWDLRVDVLEFRIGLVEIMEALNCLRSENAFVKFSMKDETKDDKDRRLHITVVDRKVTATISLPVYNATSDFDFNFDDNPVRAKIVLEAKTIRKVFHEVDPKENPSVKFFFKPDTCIITTNAQTLKCVTTFRQNTPEVTDVFADRDGLTFDYKSIFIKRLKYATNNASQVSLSMNDLGILSAQFRFAKVARNAGHAEFFANPLEPTEEM
uniref:Proliferating cell nuclear antigen n=1 Tax=Panagrolaimus sp. ES5 TaxID=591445 RepID=A0AC34FEF0_9BILA